LPCFVTDAQDCLARVALRLRLNLAAPDRVRKRAHICEPINLLARRRPCTRVVNVIEHATSVRHVHARTPNLLPEDVVGDSLVLLALALAVGTCGVIVAPLVCDTHVREALHDAARWRRLWWWRRHRTGRRWRW